MKRVISFLFGLTAFTACLVPISANALVFDQEAIGPTFYCMKKADAEEFVKALIAGDEKTVTEKQQPGTCHFHQTRFTPKKLLSTHKAEDVSLYVVEVESGGGTFYLVTAERPIPRGLSI